MIFKGDMPKVYIPYIGMGMLHEYHFGVNGIYIPYGPLNPHGMVVLIIPTSSDRVGTRVSGRPTGMLSGQVRCKPSCGDVRARRKVQYET